MTVGIQHLHTYFLFPFSLDKEGLIHDHRDLWKKYQHWIDGLDEWIACPKPRTPAVVESLGAWKRSAYSRFDMDSAAYQDMVFFHPIVRRVFFDIADGSGAGEREALLRCYAIPLPKGKRVFLEAEDRRGRTGRIEATDLRLFLFANGIGILSIGVEAFNVPAPQALWFNEALRKIYPSSGRQLREGRTPSRMALIVEQDGVEKVAVEERFAKPDMKGLLPPLSKVITELLYFADYDAQEYEPVLDERMIVYSYCSIAPETVPEFFIGSEEYQILLSRFLYVDLRGDDYRYERAFTRAQMAQQLYTRWAHEGTYYGFTSYSALAATMGSHDCDEHQVMEGFLIHRQFDTRYYLMAMVALFYRATLLDFAVRSALVSKQLYRVQEEGGFTLENIRMANDLRADFLHFSNYWYFDELANKDEEVEHFQMMCREYRVDATKREIEEEIDKLNASLGDFYQFRNTEAVNRLAMLSLIFGAGAVLTGFFGMNFGREFAKAFFEPDPKRIVVHYIAVGTVTALAFGALAFGSFVVAANWSDYRDILVPHRWKRRKAGSLKRM